MRERIVFSARGAGDLLRLGLGLELLLCGYVGRLPVEDYFRLFEVSACV
jgi:hypothetical protein